MAAINNSLSNSLDTLTDIHPIQKELVKSKLADFSTKKSDPFLTNENLINLRNWYETKNPEYNKLKELPDLSIPEHEYIALYMIKTLLTLLSIKQFPKKHNTNVSINTLSYGSNSFQLANTDITENQERLQNAKTLLSILIDYINTGYIYQKFFNIVISYLLFFSSGRIELNEDDKLELSMYLKLNDSFFIIYPTIGQINFTKVILFMKAPVCNFRCSTSRHKIHNIFRSPVSDMRHDLAHCNLTHGTDVINYKGNDSTFTYYDPKCNTMQKYETKKNGTFYKKDDVNPYKCEYPVVSNYITVLNNINKIIDDLYPYISYNPKIINDFIKAQEQNITDEIKAEIPKFILSWLVFTYFHEHFILFAQIKKFITKLYKKADRTINEIISDVHTYNKEYIIGDIKDLIIEAQNYKTLFFIASGAKSLEEFNDVFLNDILNADNDYAENIIQFGLSILPEYFKTQLQVSGGGFINKNKIFRTKNKNTKYSRNKIQHQIQIKKQNTKTHTNKNKK